MRHKFYCPKCSHYMYADSLILLCVEINKHNKGLHPFEPTEWKPEQVRLSSHYDLLGAEDEDEDGAYAHQAEEPPVQRSGYNYVVSKPCPVELTNPFDVDLLKKARIKW